METKKVDQSNQAQGHKPTAPKPSQSRKGRGFFLRNMRLQSRLILVMLLVSIPVITLAIGALAIQVDGVIRQHTNEQLAQTNHAISLKTDQWLTMNLNALKQLVSLADISSLDPARQLPILQKTSQIYNAVFHTTDATGMNIARSDNQPNQNFNDRAWFKGLLNGAQFTYQVLVTRTTNQTSLNITTPIRDSSGKMIGAISMVSNLSNISNDVLASRSKGSTGEGLTFIVDQTNKVIAHPDTKIAMDLTDYSQYPPVIALRRGETGLYEFTDQQGHHWLAYITLMRNGWGIITQEELDLALAPVYHFRQVSLAVILVGAALMAVLALLTIRRSLRPVVELTETVTAVSAGDLNRVARVSSNDEIGQLAKAFNAMTEQIRGSIVDLEQMVAERTQALSLSAEVSRRLSTILNMDQLTREVVNQLQESFAYYHVQIYLYDEARENLVMAGGTGLAGQAMLANGHKVPAGKGLVGRAAEMNQPVLVSDTGKDPDWLPNPLLPETKSELATPIALADHVLGVLDVQQNTVDGLNQTDVNLIQSIANQVAVAIQNAMAYTQTQQRAEREKLVASLGQKIQQAATIDQVLQVAVSELGQALGAQRSIVELRSKASNTDGKN